MCFGVATEKKMLGDESLPGIMRPMGHNEVTFPLPKRTEWWQS